MKPLIVVTADHETGGIVLGKGPYTLNLQALKSQKVSESGYTKIVNELRKKIQESSTLGSYQAIIEG